MAKCRVDSMDDLLQTLENAADVDSISEEMLTEGAQVLQKNIREEITSAADPFIKTNHVFRYKSHTNRKICC